MFTDKTLIRKNLKKILNIDLLLNILYIVLALEIIITLISNDFSYFKYTQLVILIIALLFALSIKIYQKILFPKFTKVDQTWHGIRYVLYETLVKNGILLDVEKHPKYDISSHLQLQKDIDELSQVIVTPDQEFIDELREIGIDGILICLFLLQSSPVYASIKAIKKALNIPLSTMYRVVNKLKKHKAVEIHYTVDSPGENFYSLTPEGESIVLQLYELYGGNKLSLPK